MLPLFRFNLLISLWGRIKEEVQKYKIENEKVERKTEK